MLALGFGLSLGLGGGGAPTARSATVASGSAGAVHTIARLLGSASTLSLIAGTDANLSLTGGNRISAAAAIGNGVSQTAVVREVLGQVAVEYPLTLTGKSAGGTPTPTPSKLKYDVLDAYETLTGRAVNNASTSEISLHTGARKAEGAAAMMIQGKGTNPTKYVNSASLGTPELAADDLIGIYAHLGDDSARQDVGQFRPAFAAGSTLYSLTYPANVQMETAITASHRGPLWQTWRADRFINGSTPVTDASIVATAKSARTQSNSAANTANAENVVSDNLIRIKAVDRADFMPMLVMTRDDAGSQQYTDWFPALNARGLVGNFYVPWDYLGRAGAWTLAQGDEMAAAGHGMAIDSDHYDKPVTAFPTRAAFLANLADLRDKVGGRWGAENARHLCYSYGTPGVGNTFTLTVTADGSDTVTTPGTEAYQFLSPGMVVRGVNVPGGECNVVICPLQNKAQLSKAIPAGNQSLTFIGRTRGIAATCNGTNKVQVASTAAIVAGHTMTGYTVPDGVTVTAIDSATVVTVSAIVPASCVVADFEPKFLEFWPDKVIDDLISAGYLSARRTQTFGGVFTGLGIDRRSALLMPGLSTDKTTTSATAFIAQVQEQAMCGRDTFSYGHADTDPAHMTQILDAVQGFQNAGLLRTVTPAEWWRRVSGRVAVLGTG